MAYTLPSIPIKGVCKRTPPCRLEAEPILEMVTLIALPAFAEAGKLAVTMTEATFLASTWAEPAAIPIPSSIIGMLLLAAALKLRIVRIFWVDKISDFLVKNLGFFFVPAGVGLMRCLGLIKEQWMPIIGSAIISTFVIIAVTGWVHQLVRRSFSSHHELSR